jgi:type I restriction enzyme R subunit
VTVDETGEQVGSTEAEVELPQEDVSLEYELPEDQIGPDTHIFINEPPPEPRKFYIDGGEVEVIGHLVYDLDPDGKKLQVVKYTEYSGRAVRTLYPTREALQVGLGQSRHPRRGAARVDRTRHQFRRAGSQQ